jgi:hypothetical protein
MTKREIERRLNADGYTPTHERVAMLARISALYRRRGVLDRGGRACSLDRCCDAAESCWAGRSSNEHPGRTAADKREPDGSIFWPWIGEHYGPGGLCVVALNLNLDNAEPESDWWDITIEYSISAHTGEYLGAGLDASPLWNYSRAGYRMAASAAAVLSWWEGRSPQPDTEPDPRALAGFVEHIARVQSIKCSPRGDRAGKPTRAMERQCPPRYLSKELALLRPGGVLVLGSEPRLAIETSHTPTLEVDEPTFACGTLTFSAQQAEYYWIPHPNNRRGGWKRGQRQLVDHLTARL